MPAPFQGLTMEKPAARQAGGNGDERPSAPPSRLAGEGRDVQGPDPMLQSKQAQREAEALMQFMDSFAAQFPAGAEEAETIKQHIVAMLQKVLSALEPPLGTVMEPPPLP